MPPLLVTALLGFLLTQIAPTSNVRLPHLSKLDAVSIKLGGHQEGLLP
jgi:hypothetical protein